MADNDQNPKNTDSEDNKAQHRREGVDMNTDKDDTEEEEDEMM
jgi:hypothetical protein